MTKKILIGVGLLIAVVIVIMGLFLVMGPKLNLKEYERLKTPAFNKLPRQKMLVVESKGDPNIVGGKAFGQLFRSFYQLKNVSKGTPVAPRARWPQSLDTPKNDWTGLYGLPVPESAQELPAQNDKDELKARFEYWDYGEVAEILHIGPYAEETPTIEKLKQFIKDNNYEISGLHEEEYLKGPGMFLKGNPKDYYTIIRYQVKKK